MYAKIKDRQAPGDLLGSNLSAVEEESIFLLMKQEKLFIFRGLTSMKR
jgi:hypothetical protein